MLSIHTIWKGISVAFFLFFLFWFFPGENNYVRLQDDVDGAFSSRHLIINSGEFFNPDPASTVQGSMNGIPRAIWPRFTDPFHLLMYVFGNLNGYALTFLILRLIGFLGIYLLGRDYTDNENPFQMTIVVAVAVAFATLPFNPSYGLTVSGVPLAFWSFFNLKHRRKMLWSHLYFFIFAFTSFFVLVGFHICLVFGLIVLVYSIKQKRMDYLMFGNVMLLGIWFILADYMLFYLHLCVDDYESSRQVFSKELGLNWKGVIGTSFIYLFNGEYNASNYLGTILLPVFIQGMYLSFRLKTDASEKHMLKLFLILFLGSGIVAAILDWKGMKLVYDNIPLFNFFNFKRFITLLPGLFFMLVLFLSVVVFRLGKMNFKYALLGIFFTFFIFNWRGNISRLKNSFNCNGWHINGETLITFNEFMNVNQYKEIKSSIPNGINVINFGISPAPCKYNGIKVLDDYQGDYPLTYKQDFRKIIEKEIAKSKKLKDVFDGWGSKCYLYSANQLEGKLSTRSGFAVETNFEINTSQLRTMNCGYILSGIIIDKPYKLGLQFEKVVVSHLNFSTIFLYKVL